MSRVDVLEVIVASIGLVVAFLGLWSASKTAWAIRHHKSRLLQVAARIRLRRAGHRLIMQTAVFTASVSTVWIHVAHKGFSVDGIAMIVVSSFCILDAYMDRFDRYVMRGIEHEQTNDSLLTMLFP